MLQRERNVHADGRKVEGVHKSTIVFKINLLKLIEKHPKLSKSSVTLTFLKNYFKDIKQICKENSSEFK